jgi:hypothetical protein
MLLCETFCSLFIVVQKKDRRLIAYGLNMHFMEHTKTAGQMTCA